MTIERGKEILEMLKKDDAFSKELLALSFDEAEAKLKEKGYDFSADELMELQKELAEYAELLNSKEELNVEELEKVAGGKMSKADKTGLGLILGVDSAALLWAGAVAVAIGW